MPFPNETSIYKIPYGQTGNVETGADDLAQAYAIEDPVSLLHKALAGVDLDATLQNDFAVSAGAGLSVNVAAGMGCIDGLVIESLAPINHPGLPDASTLYIYLKITATTKRDNSFTVEHSLSGGGMADAILIASCITSGGAVTSVDNSPTGRAPRMPFGYSGTGITKLRVVGVAGSGMQYSSPKTAIEACAAGDIVLITGGTYDIASTITIPANNITIVGTNRDACILNFTAADANDCLVASGKGRLKIECLTIQAVAGKTGWGIRLNNCPDSALGNLVITGNGLYTCICAYSGCHRLRLEAIKATCAGASHVITIQTSDDVIIRDCLLTNGAGGSQCAVMLSTANNALVDSNIIRATGASATSAVFIFDSTYAMIRGNSIIVSSPATGSYGFIKASAYSVNGAYIQILANRVISSGDLGWGIHLWTTSPYTLTSCQLNDNLVVDCAVGIKIADSRCNTTRVHDNLLHSCAADLQDAGTGTNAVDNT